MPETGDVGFETYVPIVKVGPGNPEALKYGQMWRHPEYREIAPGEDYAQTFMAVAQPRQGATVTDFGCGTGRGALLLALVGGLNVTMVDFVNECLDEDIRAMLPHQAHALRFVKADLEVGPLPVSEYGYCTDVMEHIPTAKVPRVLDNLLHAAQYVFFLISTLPDNCGTLIGETLHLTVQPYAWWLEQFKGLQATVHFSKEMPDCCLFYVSAWSSGPELVQAGRLNVTEETIRENVKTNIAGGWRQASPQLTKDDEVAILGGGPSLNDFQDEIRRLRAQGVRLVTLNGAYNWAVERRLVPVTTIIVDARPFDARFVQPVVPGCKYLLASQVHPSVLEGLQKDATWLWHTDTDLVKDILDAHYPIWFGNPGGPTVLLASIPLLRQLGYHRFHLFGCDSCLILDEHHAYAQPENDAEAVPVFVGGRQFWCHPWMVAQAQQFIDLIKWLGDEIEIEVYGDGLLAHILQTAADSLVEA